jgi:uncharacterized membrane protein YdjX (TVP38/TMEM64 family)
VRHSGHHLVTTLLLLTAATVWAGETPEVLQPVAEWLIRHPILAPFLFVTIYAVMVLLFLPGALLCLLGGALFGPWLGALLNVAGATLGSALAFLVARHLAADLVERHLNKTLQRLKRGVEREGWRFVALVRLIPVVPYDLSSYAFGLCRLPLLPLMVANALCLLPRLTVYAYIGHSGLELLSGEGEQLLDLISLATLALAVLLLPYLYLRLRQPLK